jgi:hypothetical protein
LIILKSIAVRGKEEQALLISEGRNLSQNEALMEVTGEEVGTSYLGGMTRCGPSCI